MDEEKLNVEELDVDEEDAKKEAENRRIADSLYQYYKTESDEEIQRERDAIRNAREAVRTGVPRAEYAVSNPFERTWAINRVVRERQRAKMRREFQAELIGWAGLVTTFVGGGASVFLGKFVVKWLGW